MKFKIYTNKPDGDAPHAISVGDNWETLQHSENFSSGDETAEENIEVIMLEALAADVYIVNNRKTNKIDTEDFIRSACEDRGLNFGRVMEARAMMIEVLKNATK